MGIRTRVPFFIATIFKQIMTERMLIVFECWKFQIKLESIANLHLALLRWSCFHLKKKKLAIIQPIYLVYLLISLLH